MIKEDIWAKCVIENHQIQMKSHNEIEIIDSMKTYISDNEENIQTIVAQ